MLGVETPDRTGAVRAAHAELAADTVTEDVVTVAGRVVLKRDMGKLVFATLRDRDGDLQLVLNARDLPAEVFASFQEVDLGDIIGRHRPRRHHAERRAERVRRSAGRC